MVPKVDRDIVPKVDQDETTMDGRDRFLPSLGDGPLYRLSCSIETYNATDRHTMESSHAHIAIAKHQHTYHTRTDTNTLIDMRAHALA